MSANSRETAVIGDAALAAAVGRLVRFVLFLLLVSVLALFVVRRLSGNFGEPLPAGMFLLVVVVVAGLAWLLRWPAVVRLRSATSVSRLPAWPGYLADVSSWWQANRADVAKLVQPLVGGSLLVIATAMVFSLPGLSVFEGLLGWMLAIASEVLIFATAAGWVSAGVRPETFGENRANRQVEAPAIRNVLDAPNDVVDSDSEVIDEAFEESFDESEQLLADGVIQQFTRSRNTDGSTGETIEGLLRCSFNRGESQQVVHVSFCPPLNAQPTLELHQLDGPEALVNATLTETFGARLEVRLEAAAEDDCDVVIGLRAVG